MNAIRLIVQKNEGQFTVMALDEVGSLAQVNHHDKKKAIEIAKSRVESQLDGPFEWTVQDLN